MIEKRDAVIGGIPVAKRLFVIFGAAKTTGVPGDDTSDVAKSRDLMMEHGAVHQEPVGQHYGWTVTARILEPNSLTVDSCVGHSNAP